MNSMQMVLTEEKADLYDAALDHVNDVRHEMGLSPVTELLPGIIADAFHCPIANTILSGVEDSYCSSSWQRTTVYDVDRITLDSIDGGDTQNFIVIDSEEMSQLAFQFQHAFDDGEFPELIAE